MKFARSGRWASGMLAVTVAVTLLGELPAAAARPNWKPQAPQDVAGVKTVNAKDRPAVANWSAESHAVRGPRPVTWPTAGTATADLSNTGLSRVDAKLAGGDIAYGSQVRAGSTPVRIAAAAGARPDKVAVTVHDRAATAKAGVQGVLVSLSRPGSTATMSTVSAQLDYAGFADAYGAQWGSRLQLVRKPACALSTPELAACRTSTPVATVNNPKTQTLTAAVPVSTSEATVLAAQAAASGDGGDYTATSLSPAGTWQVSAQTGDFSWSYPMRMPPSLGGPAPSFTLGYSSGSIDGRTALTNNQGSWIGDGWDAWPGFIERKYQSCSDDNPDHKTGDQCWYGDNASLSLSGHAGELLLVSGNTWRLKNDDGTRIEKLTNAARGNGDNDNEYWKVTTTDGMQYFFGYHKLPNWVSGKTVTNSTWTAPVYGNNSGEPCYNATFANAYCNQAWRWNLDYVIDPHQNTMALFYGKETGAYGRDVTASQRTTYDRGGWLDHVDYGMRENSEYTENAPLRVQFTTAERCLSGCWTGTAWTSDPVASAWADSPWDQYCKAAPCDDQSSPTFWTARRLSKVTTQLRDSATTYRDVESLTLRHEFLNAGTGEHTPMWLRGITRTGHVTTAGGVAVSDPEITFDPGSAPLPNRVDGLSDSRTELMRWRIKAIRTESGGIIGVTYSGPDCTRTTLPVPHSNTKRCMPSWYAPAGQELSLDWFHKYVVKQIDLQDGVTDQLNTTSFYDYLDTPMWAYNTDELTKTKHRTWGNFRGYGRVQIRQGDPTGQQTAVEYRYLRGMDGDKQPTGVRDVHVTDSWGGTIEDHEALQGFVLQQITFNGPGGAEVSSTLNTPWKNGPTATRTRNSIITRAWKINTEIVRNRIALEVGGYRTTRVTTGFNADGQPVTIDDAGDEAAVGDEICSRTSYARNDTTWMIDRVSQAEKLAGTCASATTPAAPSTVLSRSRTFYDSYVDASSFGAAPTKGDVVRTEELDTWTGTNSDIPAYAGMSSAKYDGIGRQTEATDARGYKTTYGYTATNGGQVTQTVITDPKNYTVTTVKEPAWDLPTKITDANGAVTELTYDGLGRSTNVWLPGRAKATQSASKKFTYQMRNSGGPTAVTTETLLPPSLTPSYRKSVNLYDGFLRQRQNQTQATGGGRTVTDTFYNTLGQTAWTSAPYYDSTNTAVGTAVAVPQGQIPSITESLYDGAGRVTASVFKANGTERWRTTTRYGGDRAHVIPPTGGTASSNIADARGQTIAQRQYKSFADVGTSDSSRFDQTNYTYTLLGQSTMVTDPVGNRWSYKYDLRGRQIEAIDPDKGTSTSAYDAAGNLQTSTGPVDGTIVTLAYTYDELGRKTSMRDNSITGAKRAEWIYDTLPNGKGKLTSSTRYAGGNAYTSKVDAYDTYGRVTSASVVMPAAESSLCASGGADPCTYTTTTAYRNTGVVNNYTLPAIGDLPSEKITPGYTDIGAPGILISSVHGTYVGNTMYDKLGQLTSRTLGASGSWLQLLSSFDEPTRRLTGSSVLPENKPEAARYAYTYDSVGNVTKVTEQPTGQPTADHQCFNYDYLRRMNEAWTPSNGDCNAARTTAGLGGPAPYWHSWTFDKTGNRLSEVKHKATGDSTYDYTHPAAGTSQPHTVTKVVASGGEIWTRNYTYDNGGNTKTRPTSTGAIQTLKFDREGRLESQAEGSITTRYIYDADGNRLIRTDGTGKTLFLAGGQEIRAEGTVKKGTRYYSHSGQPIAVRTAAGLSWIASDHHGTAELTINASTLAVAKRQMLPYGEQRGSAGTWAAGMDKGFVGGTKDPTGLTHLGAREYDPTLGRFVSVDPLIDSADPQQMHGYAYGNNNPMTFSDPTGLLSCRWEQGRSTCSPPDSSIGAWLGGFGEGFVDAPGEMISGIWSAATNPGKAYDGLQQQFAHYRSMGMVSPELCVLADCNKMAGIYTSAQEGDGEAAGYGLGEYGFDLALAAGTAGTGTAARRVVSTVGKAAARSVDDLYRLAIAQRNAAMSGIDAAEKAATGSGRAALGGGPSEFTVVVGAFDLKTGAVSWGMNSCPRFCGEFAAAQKLGIPAAEQAARLRFTAAMSRDPNGNWVVKPVCHLCQSWSGRPQYAPGTPYKPGGTWDGMSTRRGVQP